MISIKFEYDRANDIHIAFPVCHIATEDDCVGWAAAYAEYFVPLKRKVDAIFVCDMFTLDPMIGGRWCEYRSVVISRFIRYSARVATASTATLITAIGPNAQAPRNYVPDVQFAIASILYMRSEGARPVP